MKTKKITTLLLTALTVLSCLSFAGVNVAADELETPNYDTVETDPGAGFPGHAHAPGENESVIPATIKFEMSKYRIAVKPIRTVKGRIIYIKPVQPKPVPVMK